MDDLRHDDAPLPTDSMVTVRLSDIQLHPEVADLDSGAADLAASTASPTSTPASRRGSSCSSQDESKSSTANSVDWEELDKTEEHEARGEGTDESTALLLARLEQENNALAVNPKSATAAGTPSLGDTRPPSLQHLKKLVTGPQRQSLRYSLLPPPQMTELEFWAALVADYPHTAQRLPTLTSNKIRGGVPPPLRGVVWPSIAGAHDSSLHAEFQRLSTETSPYDGLIGKDVGRSFPNVEMFREKNGEGQAMLGRVLRAFSLYDAEIGYCQGLGFVVGPLLMHMNEAEAFSVLVRLMEHYDLRSCYLPDLAGLHLRIYQFEALLFRHLPELAAHLRNLKVEPLYVSQWFLSFFAVTCPLPMLLRIYDVILAEGATETLMRVALSLMQRNQKKLFAFSEFEDAMQFLLSRSLWDTYTQHADDLVADFVSLTVLVSRDSLQTLDTSFRQSQNLTAASALKNAASSLLGRFWTGSYHVASKSAILSLTIPGGSALRKTTSGHSLTSTLNSVDSNLSDESTLPSEVSDTILIKSDAISIVSVDAAVAVAVHTTDRELHHQIEELLTELSKMQHRQSEMSRDLQREREERAEDRDTAKCLVETLQKQSLAIKDLIGDEQADTDPEVDELMLKASSQFAVADTKRVSILQSKHQLRDAAAEWKEKHDTEASKCYELSKQLDDRMAEHVTLTAQLRDARAKFQDTHRDKQRLERTVQELRSRSSPVPDSPCDTYTPVSEVGESKLLTGGKPGLREFKLGRSETNRSSMISTYSKRSSSLNAQFMQATEHQQPIASDSLLLELVNAKTAEAMARQELEETRGKLDALRKIISGPTTSPSPRSNPRESPSPKFGSPVGDSHTPKAPEAGKGAFHTPSASVGGFFSGWVKRT